MINTEDERISAEHNDIHAMKVQVDGLLDEIDHMNKLMKDVCRAWADYGDITDGSRKASLFVVSLLNLCVYKNTVRFPKRKK